VVEVYGGRDAVERGWQPSFARSERGLSSRLIYEKDHSFDRDSHHFRRRDDGADRQDR